MNIFANIWPLPCFTHLVYIISNLRTLRVRRTRTSRALSSLVPTSRTIVVDQSVIRSKW